MMTHRLKSWPYKAKIGIHKQNQISDKSELHIFDHWVYIGSVRDELGLEDIKTTKSELVFDLNTYKLLTKVLSKPRVKVIEIT